MAIYHLSSKIFKRSDGKSAVNSAAYRAGATLTDERTGLVHSYAKKSDVSYSTILAPAGAPEWVHDRSALWNAVEAAEKRHDSQLAREIEVALPRELTPDQQIELGKKFCDRLVKMGMVVDLNFHKLGDSAPHFHAMCTMRDISPDGLGKKNRDWNRRELLQQLRVDWQTDANSALQSAARPERIDHRSNAERGIMEIPQTKHYGKPSRIAKHKLIAEANAKLRALLTPLIDQINKLRAEVVVQKPSGPLSAIAAAVNPFSGHDEKAALKRFADRALSAEPKPADKPVRRRRDNDGPSGP